MSWMSPFQRLGENAVGLPAAVQQDVDRFLDLFLEAVVEVVVHLLDELVVVKAVEIEIVVFRHIIPHGKNGPGNCTVAGPGWSGPRDHFP